MKIKENLTTVNFWSGNGSSGSKQNKFIVIHYVGAVSSAKNNSDYFKSTYRGASANYFVDENDIYRVVKDTDSAWHCGTNGKYYNSVRNYNSIGIEMCCFDNIGKLDVSEKVVEKTIELTKELMKKYNIPVSNVVRHYDVTRKMCPLPFVENETRWNDFKNQLISNNSCENSNKEETNKKLYLPKTATSWRVYPLDKHPIVGNESGFLRPSKFGGLTYDILGYSMTNVAIIQTRDFGKVQIYVAPQTGAIIK